MPHYQVIDATKRFSDRVAEYTRFRPSYPREILGVLEDVTHLKPETMVADIGAGTGILTRLFADSGHRVFAVEPNDEMRLACSEAFRDHGNVVVAKGQAEAIPLLDESIDLIVAGQAFHWFAPEETLREFSRIATKRCALAVVWNHRPAGVTAFMDEFESILAEHGGEYELHHAKGQIDEELLGTFFQRTMTLRTFRNPLQLDMRALQGLMHSISYAPVRGHPRFEPMMEQLSRSFAEHQRNGMVTMDYETRLYCGALARP